MESRSEQAEWRRQLQGFNAAVHDDAVSRGRTRASVFTCECGKSDCVDGVLLDPDEYEALRAFGGGYILAAGHHVSRTEDARRVARRLVEDAQALRAQAEHQQRRLRKLLRR